MAKSMKVRHYPLSKVARFVIALAFLINIVALIITWYYYPELKSTILIVPAIFLFVFAIILLLLRFRYTLFERYPYILNLPSFVYRLGMEKNPDVEGQIISRVFSVHAFTALYLSILNLIITSAAATQNSSFLLPAILTLVIVFVVTIFSLYRNIYISFAAKKGKRGTR